MINVCELDMRKQHVYDPLISKRQQYLLATQLVRAVLKVSAQPRCVAYQLIIYTNRLTMSLQLAEETKAIDSTSLKLAMQNSLRHNDLLVAVRPKLYLSSHATWSFDTPPMRKL